MKRSHRLQVVVDLKENNEKKCLEALAVEQIKKQQKEEQISNLQNYRQDYLNKNSEQMKQGLSIFHLREFQAFIMKIDDAVKSEEKLLVALQTRVVQLQDLWEKAHLNTKNMQKIQTEAKSSEQKALDKKEQLEMDERAGRKKMNGIDSA